MSQPISVIHYQSPVGELLVGSLDGQLCICDWTGKKRAATDQRLCRQLNAHYEPGESDTIKKAINQLEEYFNGQRAEFTIPVAFNGTDFQCQVWTELMKIPYGTTISYAELARRINNPKAVRAVAAANAANPVSIFVPCHRVIGSDNKLTGYGGGLDVKEKLLRLEAECKIKSQKMGKPATASFPIFQYI